MRAYLEELLKNGVKVFHSKNKSHFSAQSRHNAIEREVWTVDLENKKMVCEKSKYFGGDRAMGYSPQRSNETIEAPLPESYILVSEKNESSNCGERYNFEIEFVKGNKKETLVDYYWDTFKCPIKDCYFCRYAEFGEKDEDGWSEVIGCNFDKVKMRKEVEEYKSLLNLE